MLDLKKISGIIPYSTEWYGARLGKMTSSKISCICGVKGIGDGGMTYIRSKASEKITRISTEKNIITEDIMFGIENEPKSILNYKEKYAGNAIAIVQHKHIIFSDYFSSTPDFLVINKDLGDTYDCETGETKSYPNQSKHLQHCEADTPIKLKQINPEAYWQVIHQMYCAEVVVGNITFFNPLYPIGSEVRSHRIVFKKIELLSDFKLLKERMDLAVSIYDEYYNKYKVKQL